MCITHRALSSHSAASRRGLVNLGLKVFSVCLSDEIQYTQNSKNYGKKERLAYFLSY